MSSTFRRVLLLRSACLSPDGWAVEEEEQRFSSASNFFLQIRFEKVTRLLQEKKIAI